MIELPRGDIWAYHPTHPIVITTNPYIRSDGACVMGKGTARDAARRYRDLPFDLANLIKTEGNHTHYWNAYNLITFPVKRHHFLDPADLDLIEQSARELVAVADRWSMRAVYLTRVGCGNGRLPWEVVKRRLTVLDDRFCVVDKAAPSTVPGF